MSQWPQRLVSPTAVRRNLRELTAGPRLIELPGPYDAASAQLLARIGFEVLWAGGKVASQGSLGVPDVNLMTMTEQLRFCSTLVDATGIAVVADIDDGYGQALMVTRTVQAFERADVAAVVIEDQASPKHCTWYGGLPLNLVSKEQMAAKVKAAVDARSDESMMIWARTDALPALHRTDAALERMHAYADAGADAIFLTSSSLDDLTEIGRGWGRPEPLCMSAVNFPHLEADGIKSLGFSLRLHPREAMLAALGAVKRAYQALHDIGSFGDALAGSLPADELEELGGHSEARTLDEQYRLAGGVEARG